jgi:hypothetical protein
VRRSTIAILMLLLLALGGMAFVIGQDLLNKSRAKETVTHIRSISSLLQLERPPKVDAHYLSQMLAKYGVGKSYLLDGWNRPLMVQIIPGRDGMRHYRVISLGRDGRLGTCCRRFLEQDWDEDAVIEDGAWKQAWSA